MSGHNPLIVSDPGLIMRFRKGKVVERDVVDHADESMVRGLCIMRGNPELS